MHHIVYKTSHQATGKFYIGVHSTYDIEDGYLGSGYLLKRALKKYGRGSFRREILHVCGTRDEAFAKERELVNRAFVLQEDTYNLAEGGSGRSGPNRRSKNILIYDSDLQLVKSCGTSNEAARFLQTTGAIIFTACRNAQKGKASQVRGSYVCYDGDTVRKKDTSFMTEHNRLIAQRNVGRKRPDHSLFMKQKAADNPTGLLYFTPLHVHGTNRVDAISAYSSDMISVWCKHSTVIITKMSIIKLTPKLRDKISFDWVGKTRREIGFYTNSR